MVLSTVVKVKCANCGREGKAHMQNFCFKVKGKNYGTWLCNPCKTIGSIIINIDKIIKEDGKNKDM